jgi:hypothetical protein
MSLNDYALGDSFVLQEKIHQSVDVQQGRLLEQSIVVRADRIATLGSDVFVVGRNQYHLIRKPGQRGLGKRCNRSSTGADSASNLRELNGRPGRPAAGKSNQQVVGSNLLTRRLARNVHVQAHLRKSCGQALCNQATSSLAGDKNLVRSQYHIHELIGNLRLDSADDCLDSCKLRSDNLSQIYVFC